MVKLAVDPPRARRADAQRNRIRVLNAARAAFGEQGDETCVASIAQRAGVGIGTVYRHFPTKEALREALIFEQLESLAGELAAARAEEPDAWSAFRRFFLAAARMQIRDRSLMQFLAGTSVTVSELERARSEMYGRARALMREAQRQGAMRGDVEPGDLPLLLGGIAQVLTGGVPRAEKLGERLVAIVLDGLESPGNTPLLGHALGPKEIGALFYGTDMADEASARLR